jgi:hypothetical protein
MITMIFEIAVLFALFIFVLFLLTEIANDVILGVIGGVVMIVLGYWVFTGGIEIMSGSTSSGIEAHTSVSTVVGNTTTSITNITSSGTETSTYTKATAPVGNFSQIFGTLIILLGIYQTLKYPFFR